MYRAIKLNINLFRWARALDLALKHKVHVDTVLAYRQKYLQSFEREEVNQKFLQYFKSVRKRSHFLLRITYLLVTYASDLYICIATPFLFLFSVDVTDGLRLEDSTGQ